MPSSRRSVTLQSGEPENLACFFSVKAEEEGQHQVAQSKGTVTKSKNGTENGTEDLPEGAAFFGLLCRFSRMPGIRNGVTI